MTRAVLFPAVATAGMLILAGSASAEKLPNLSSLQGAWVEQSMSCEQVYQPAKRSMAFRKDVGVFAHAFIVSGRRLRTPGASCTISRISYKGDRMVLDLGCTTTITTSPVNAYFSSAEDGSLRRYSDDADHVGSRYEPCKP